jgi:hypothetical protein
MLEWQAMEELVGLDRASKVIEWKQRIITRRFMRFCWAIASKWRAF